MKWSLAFSFIFFHYCVFSQADSTLRLRAFPITDYFVEVNDSIKIVQVELPEGYSIPLKQAGVLFGVYNSSLEDAVQKATGRCQLVKENFHYFGMTGTSVKWIPVKGDVIYTFVKKTILYEKHVIPVASHFIGLLNVYGEPLYDRHTIFSSWKENDEKKFMDSVRSDIQFTGQYMLEHQPDTDKIISSGEYKGKSTLYIMAEIQNADIQDFFNYMIARPRLYAGKEWKVSEIFATWLAEGTPRVKK